MELIGASWIIFIKYTSYILSKLEKLKYLENLPVFFKILLVGYCIHINSVKSANKIVPYLIFYSTPWFGQCVECWLTLRVILSFWAYYQQPVTKFSPSSSYSLGFLDKKKTLSKFTSLFNKYIQFFMHQGLSFLLLNCKVSGLLGKKIRS